MPDLRPMYTLVCGALFCLALAAPPHVQAQAPTPKVLIIGIDGIRPDVLAEVPTPNLDALAEDGFFTGEARMRYPTISGPGWSSMMTGVWLTKHGVVNNSFHGKQYDRYPDVMTRIESVRPELNTFVVADWLPLVTSDNNGPLFSEAVDVTVVMNGYDVGWAEADDASVRMAAEHIRHSDPDALFVYIGNADETSHQAGSIGEEYRSAIAEADRLVGVLMEAVRSRATYGQENWLVISSTDHGRTERGGHGGESPEETTIYFLASGPAADPGWDGGTARIVDVAVTAMVHLGIEIDPDWGLDGRPVGLRGR